MGNIFASLISGFARVVGDLFAAPVDFLSGKSCISKCGSTWDLICYIENFCIGNLLKLLAVSILFYAVMLFFYLLWRVGICSCICSSAWKMLWACLSSCFSSCEHGCMFVWFRLNLTKRRHARNELALEMQDSSWGEEGLEESFSSSRRRCRESRRWSHMERSLRARSHRVRVGISRRLVCVDERWGAKRRAPERALRHIRVSHTSRFARKGNARRVCCHQSRWL